MTTFLDLHRAGRPLLAPNPWDLGSARVLAHYPVDEAAERVAAAVVAAGADLVLTARADNFFHGTADLEDTIARLQAYERAGAHVLYAPGLERLDDIRAVVEAVRTPVNVLLRPAGPTVAELAEAGVARITVGGAFAFAALGTLVEMAQQLLDEGTVGDGRLSGVGMRAAKAALSR
jgi:2-methylisocitrate lyase-like PEP mutase family enzyme